jgi:hypothetical protein
LSSSETIGLFGIIFVIGAIMFGIGNRLLRGRDDQRVLAWTLALGAPPDQPLDVETRLDVVERLALLHEPWCIDALRAASLEERDEAVAAAIRRALDSAKNPPVTASC